jgi:hypothetical protein
MLPWESGSLPEAVRKRRRSTPLASCVASSCHGVLLRWGKGPPPSKLHIVCVLRFRSTILFLSTRRAFFSVLPHRRSNTFTSLITVFFIVSSLQSLKMEKYTDATSPSQDASDFENASLLDSTHTKQETERRRNYIYLTLFNLFIFTLSMLSLICAVMSQKDSSSNSAAKLMDEFNLFCTHTSFPPPRRIALTHLPSPRDARNRVLARQVRTPEPAQLVQVRRHNRRRGECVDGRGLPYAPLSFLSAPV